MDYQFQNRGLRHMDSQETFVSLMQLDPSPMETDKDLPPLPEPDENQFGEKGGSWDGSASVGSVGLSSSGSNSGHGSIYYLARIQKYSSYAFSLFASIHLANTSIIPLIAKSVPASETYLIQARELYQSPFTEPLLVGLPIIAHISSGVALRFARRAQNIRRYGSATPSLAARPSSRAKGPPNSSVNNWPPLSWISVGGYWYMGFLGAHVVVNRVLPIMFDGDSANIGLGFVSHGFARHPTVAYAAYVGLIGTGCAHMTWGAAKWFGVAPSTASFWGKSSLSIDRSERKRRRRRWYAVHFVALVTGGAWAAGGFGIIAQGGAAPGWVGTLYDGLYAKVGLAA